MMMPRNSIFVAVLIVLLAFSPSGAVAKKKKKAAAAFTLGDLLTQLEASTSCGKARRAFTLGTQSFRDIYNTVKDVVLDAEGFNTPTEYYRVLMIPGSSTIVDDWVKTNIRNSDKGQAWTTSKLVKVAVDPSHEEYIAARNLAKQFVGNTLLWAAKSENDTEAYTAPDWDGEQLAVLFDPNLPKIVATPTKLYYSMFLGDAVNPTQEYRFENVRPLYCASTDTSSFLVLRPAEIVADLVVMTAPEKDQPIITLPGRHRI